MENFNQTIENLEKALETEQINEGQYIKLMNMAKDRYNKAHPTVDEDDDETEVQLIDETDTHMLLRECGDPVTGILSSGRESYKYYVVKHMNTVDYPTIYHIANDDEAVTWFRERKWD